MNYLNTILKRLALAILVISLSACGDSKKTRLNETTSTAKSKVCTTGSTAPSTKVTRPIKDSNYPPREITLSISEWPPYHSKNLQHNGLTSYLISQVFAQVNVKVNYKYFDAWARAYQQSVDGHVGGTAVWEATESRLNHHYATNPMLILDRHFIHLKENPLQWQSLADLKGLEIGTHIGYTTSPELKLAIDSGLLTISPVKSEYENLQKLLQNRIDTFPAEISVVESVTELKFTAEDAKRLTYHPKVLYRFQYRVLISKATPDAKLFVNLFNEGLAKLKMVYGEKFVINPADVNPDSVLSLSKQQRTLFKQLRSKIRIEPDRKLETLKLTNGEWGPFCGKSIAAKGFLSKIVSESFSLESIKVKYNFFNWKRAYQEGKSDDFDGSVGWRKNPEREKDYFFSDPITIVHSNLFHLKKTDFSWATIDDLKKWHIGTTASYFYSKEFTQLTNQNLLKIQTASDDLTNFRKLLAGRIEVFPCSSEVGLQIIKDNFSPEEVSQFTFNSKPLARNPIYMILKKSDPKNKHRIEVFNRGLKFLKKNGFYKSYLQQYLPATHQRGK